VPHDNPRPKTQTFLCQHHPQLTSLTWSTSFPAGNHHSWLTSCSTQSKRSNARNSSLKVEKSSNCTLSEMAAPMKTSALSVGNSLSDAPFCGHVWAPLLVWNPDPFELNHAACSQSCSSSAPASCSSKSRSLTTWNMHFAATTMDCSNQLLRRGPVLGQSKPLPCFRMRLGERHRQRLKPSPSQILLPPCQRPARRRNSRWRLLWEAQMQCHTDACATD
jgi:hypothetical protein